MLISEISHIPMQLIAAGGFSGAISGDKGELYLWGTAQFGEFLVPTKIKTSPHGWSTVNLAIGNQFACAVTRDGLLYSWGMNSNG
jgi:hypothetical protein